MSSVVRTPVLSKKQQNKSLSARKKPLKTIRNVLTSSRAVYWPTITEEESNKIIDVLKCVTNSTSTQNDGRRSKTDPIKTSKKSKTSGLSKFGINEVSKCLGRDECAAVLLDANMPYVLTAHVLAMATSKQIPLLCLKNFNDVTKSCFEFGSSSMCFSTQSEKLFPRVFNVINDIWHKKYRLYEKESCEDRVTNQSPDITPKITTETPTNTNGQLSEDFIKLSTQETTHITFSSRKRKSNPIFQPLLIKRIQNNPNR